MKTKKKASSNRELDRKTDFILVELQHLKQIVNDGLIMFTKYIKFNGDDEKFTEYLKKEAEDVRSELQKPSG